ncbi:unnamed protein product [Ostreobium quekettii]|uniref:Uncharacterized protein n=1 Tax=Ostreobium quekettii TaxID=121088 RepID=A0A8S1IRH6_9CHLO|nr:unnamed protein product [Ostreobium quekettii]
MLTMAAEALAEISLAAGGLRLGFKVKENELESVDGSTQPLGPHLQEEGALVEAGARASRDCLTRVANAVDLLQDKVEGLQDFETAVSHLQSFAVKATLGKHEGSHPGASIRSRDRDTGPRPAESVRTPGAEELEEDVKRLEELLDVEISSEGHRSVSKAMAEAARIHAERRDGVVNIPDWTRRPSSLERRWLEYSLAGLVAVWGASWLLRHSPLCGSRDFYDWGNAVKFAVATHVVTPLSNLKDEVLVKFRRTGSSVVSKEDFETSKRSLYRMLKDFEKDYRDKVRKAHKAVELPSDTPKQAVQVVEGMETLMRAYEMELKSPVWNLVNGSLARALLIQVQKLKVDTEAAMLELDQILEANELNVALIAAIPALFLAGSAAYWLLSVINRAGPDPRKSLVPCRLGLVELERALNRSSMVGMTPEARGLVILRAHKVYVSCHRVYQDRDRTSEQSEWPTLEKELIDLARPLPPEKKIKICERMRTTYTIFQA